MKKFYAGCWIVLVMFAYSGCARIMYTYPSRLDLTVRAVPKSAVLVAVQDKRVYVLKRDTQESFAGLIRSGTGVVTHHESATGRPLADDIAGAVARSLRKNGATVTTLRLEPTLTEVDAQSDLVKRNPGRVLFIAIRELKADMNLASARTTISYDLRVTVYGKSGKIAGSTVLTGKDAENFARSQWPDREQERVAAAVNERLSVLLNDPAVVKALQ